MSCEIEAKDSKSLKYVNDDLLLDGAIKRRISSVIILLFSSFIFLQKFVAVPKDGEKSMSSLMAWVSKTSLFTR